MRRASGVFSALPSGSGRSGGSCGSRLLDTMKAQAYAELRSGEDRRAAIEAFRTAAMLAPDGG